MAAVLLVGMAVPAARAADDSVDTCNWPMFGHDARRSFATADDCASLTNISAATLSPKWFFHAPDAVSASPAIVDGHVYVGDWAGNFSSFDSATGAVDWTYKVDDTSPIGLVPTNRFARRAIVNARPR